MSTRSVSYRFAIVPAIADRNSFDVVNVATGALAGIIFDTVWPVKGWIAKDLNGRTIANVATLRQAVDAYGIVLDESTIGSDSDAPNFVRDVGYHFSLVTGDSASDTLEYLGLPLDEFPTLFVHVVDGDFETVYGCSRSVPTLDARVWPIVLNGRTVYESA